ncbi:hypothetical protein [Parafrankia elaeagni]|uniref:hypothetical protein n=1 Tax=Parafrankia elaeagni TaxID=222534 RepID=UPI0003688E83|nr:hypothetical protein [Parafrankia elaeagni]
MAISKRIASWLGSARNTAGCAAGLCGIALGATGVVPAPYWPLATAALYAAGALAMPARRPTRPVPRPPDPRGPSDVPARHEAARHQATQHQATQHEAERHEARDSGGRAQVRDVLDAQIARLAGRSTPVEPDLVSAVRDLADAVREFLDDPGLAGRSHGPADSAGRAIERTVRDHLPGVLDEYLALPRLYATLHRRPDGRTPHQAAFDRLTLLSAVVHAVTAAAWRGDEGAVRAQAERLAREPLLARDEQPPDGGPDAPAPPGA